MMRSSAVCLIGALQASAGAAGGPSFPHCAKLGRQEPGWFQRHAPRLQASKFYLEVPGPGLPALHELTLAADAVALPASYSGLTALTRLSLAGLAVQLAPGCLPPGLRSLAVALEGERTVSRGLPGTLPAAAERARSLAELWLQWSPATALDLEPLSALRALTALRLRSARLAALPAGWSALSALRELSLHEAAVEGGDLAALSALSSLSSLHLVGVWGGARWEGAWQLPDLKVRPGGERMAKSRCCRSLYCCLPVTKDLPPPNCAPSPAGAPDAAGRKKRVPLLPPRPLPTPQELRCLPVPALPCLCLASGAHPCLTSLEMDAYQAAANLEALRGMAALRELSLPCRWLPLCDAALAAALQAAGSLPQLERLALGPPEAAGSSLEAGGGEAAEEWGRLAGRPGLALRVLRTFPVDLLGLDGARDSM